MRPLQSIARLLVLGSSIAATAAAQDFVKAAELPQAIQVLDHAPSKNELPCSIRFSRTPRLDFQFRYTAGFLIECHLGEIIAPGTKLVAYLRITPQQGEPVLMTESFEMQQVKPHASSDLYSKPSQLVVNLSGGFAVGPGHYSVDLVLTDRQGRTCRNRQTIKPEEDRGAGNVPFALQPGAVAPLMNTRWNGALRDKGLRLTVFLNAYVPNGLTYLSVLEHAYLLQTLSTLLTQLPCRSVRLVAFELDRQQVMFSSERFDSTGFLQLQRALKGLNYASISVQALQYGSWRNFLVGLVQTESASSQPPDAIVFLGAWGSHEWEKLPQDTTRRIEIADAHVFYFELFPLAGGAPDGVELLTRDLHGSVFAISSADTLAQAIKKTQALSAASINQGIPAKPGAQETPAH